jgi:AcrR family transcriptional regulator
VPRLWTKTIETHRAGVRDAILDTTASLVADHGLRAVTMSQIAEATGIGRATLYKYFPDVEAILLAWHERLVNAHLGQFMAAPGGDGTALERLEAVLSAYALVCYEVAHQHHGADLMALVHHGPHQLHQGPHHGELAALVHQGPHMARAHDQLIRLLQDLLAEGAAAGEVRVDVPVVELASYCLHALSAGGAVSSKPAVRRLVGVTLRGLRRTTP